jgi:hypothetical protein
LVDIFLLSIPTCKLRCDHSDQDAHGFPGTRLSHPEAKDVV